MDECALLCCCCRCGHGDLARQCGRGASAISRILTVVFIADEVYYWASGAATLNGTLEWCVGTDSFMDGCIGCVSAYLIEDYVCNRIK